MKADLEPLMTVGLYILRIVAVSLCFCLLASAVTIAAKNEGQTEIIAVDWSPDGSMIAGAGTNGLLGVWDAITLELLFSLPSHMDSATDVAWSPDGTKLATGGQVSSPQWRSVIRIWSRDGELITELTVDGYRITALAWSPDGAMLAGGSYAPTGHIPSLQIW